ncbi:MAG: hypothetical protein RTU30_07960 [Candidatus Thorarchaeota archaeon]
MIAHTMLYDLRSTKVLSSVSFVQGEIENEHLHDLADRYLAESSGEPLSMDFQGSNAYVHRIEELIVLIGVGDISTSKEDASQFSLLATEFSNLSASIGTREARERFPTLANEFLMSRINICFLHGDLRSRSVVQRLIDGLNITDASYSSPILIGSFKVLVSQALPDLITDYDKVNSFVFVVSDSSPDEDLLKSTIERIRNNSNAMILIIPESDDQLELARQYELEHDLILSDFDSERPSHLLLSILAMSGYLDIQPDLAKDTLVFDRDIDTESESESKLKESGGHQGFFVIDKLLGKPYFSYYYRDSSPLLEHAPNIVAAVSMFRIDSFGSRETSVFQTGDLKYAVIEREDLIFALVTTAEEDIEEVRSRFLFLPDLYLEDPPAEVTDSTNLYQYPLFTLKLLAALPPEEWLPRYTPYHKEEPIWDMFTSPLVKDFVRAVWNSLDGKITLATLLKGDGPELILGAIHLLKRMDAIDVHLVLSESDIPYVITEPSTDVYDLYSHLKDIIHHVNNKNMISQIAQSVGIDAAILLTVFSELYRRSFIGLQGVEGPSA